MIKIYQKEINGIALLEVVEENSETDVLPTVIFHHGWTNFKESTLVNGYELAKRGFRALLPDALFHGERSKENIKLETDVNLWDVIDSNLNEMSLLKDYYVGQKLTDAEKVGVAGLSMGGMTTCAALTKYDWIKAAAVLMGSPDPIKMSEWSNSPDSPADYSQKTRKGFTKEEHEEYLRNLSLHEQPEKLSGRPVYFWHDTEDNWVPVGPTKDFVEKQQQYDHGKNLTISITEGEGHHVPAYISVEMADFFKKTLK